MQFRVLISFFILNICIFSCQLNAGDKDPFESMKSAIQKVAENSKMDIEEKSVVTDVSVVNSSPVPDSVSQEVPLDEITTENIYQAYAKLGGASVFEDRRVELDKLGMATTTLLFAQPSGDLKTTVRNIVDRGLTRYRPENVKLVVNSSPVPFINAQILNLADYKSAEEVPQKNSFSVKSDELSKEQIQIEWQKEMRKSVKPQLKILISAGMLASVKTVDELAGQIYKAVSIAEPKVFGVREDKRFTKSYHRANKIIEAIEKQSNELKDSSSSRGISPLDLLKAEVSAMDLLLEAEYNIWAVYTYNDRMIRWIGDQLLSSSKHTLTRLLLMPSDPRGRLFSPRVTQRDRSAGGQRIIFQYLDDPSFALRLQALSYYVAYLDTAKRGSEKVVKKSQSFNFSTKLLQQRLKLYTNTYFSGLAVQLTGLSIGLGTVGVAIFEPQFFHSAYMAFINTMDFNSAFSYLGNQVSQIKDSIGELSNKVLDWSGFNAESSYLGSEVSKSLADQLSNYKSIVIGAGVVAAGATVLRYSKSINRAFSILLKKYDDSNSATYREKIRQANNPLEKQDSSSQQSVDLKVETRSGSSRDYLSELRQESIKASTSFYSEASDGSPAKLEALISFIDSFFGEVKNAGSRGLGWSRKAPSIAGALVTKKYLDLKNSSKTTFDMGLKRAGAFGSSTRNVARRTTLSAMNRARDIKNNSIELYDLLAGSGPVIKQASSQAVGYASKAGLKFTTTTLSGIRLGSGIIFIKLPIATYRGIARTSLGMVSLSSRFVEGSKKTVISTKKAFQETGLEIKEARERKRVRKQSELKEKIELEEKQKIERKAYLKTRSINNSRIHTGDLEFLSRTIKFYYEDFANVIDTQSTEYLKNQIMKISSNVLAASKSNRIDRTGFINYLKILENVLQIGTSAEYREKNRKLIDLERELITSREFLTVLSKLSDVFDRLPEEPRPASNNDIDYFESLRVRMNERFKVNWRPVSHFASLYLGYYKVLNNFDSPNTENREEAYRKALADYQGLSHTDIYNILIKKPFLEDKGHDWIEKALLGSPDVMGLAVDRLSLSGTIDNWLLSKKLLIGKKNSGSRYMSELPPALQIKFLNHYNFKYNKENGPISKKINSKFENLVNQYSSSLFTKISSVDELLNKLNSEFKHFNFNPDIISYQLLKELSLNLNILQSYEDIVRVFESEIFWKPTEIDLTSTSIEAPIVEYMKISKQSNNSNDVFYDPRIAERIHSSAVTKLKKWGQYPEKSDFEGLEYLWRLLTSRAVSTTTDKILAQILESADENFVRKIKADAISRISDQAIRDRFARERVLSSGEYNRFLSTRKLGKKPGSQFRTFALYAQQQFGGPGIAFSNFMEEVSVQIGSTEEEAKLIEDLKTENLISSYSRLSGGQDVRLEMFDEMLRHIKLWSKQHQMEFLLFLRGSLQAEELPYLDKHFPVYGPQRARQIFQSIPPSFSMALVDLYLTETILRNSSVNKGYTKKLLTHILKETKDENARKYASEMLDALLAGITGAGNEPFQRTVVSALVVMRPDEHQSLGQTIKVILEQFPGVGTKIAQYLIPLRVLADDVNEVLRTAQDRSLPPTQVQKYQDAKLLVNGGEVPFRIVRDLGSGSMKYTYLAENLEDSSQLVNQVFREDIQNSSALYINVLRETVKYLIEKDQKRWSFIDVVVEGAISAMEKEKVFLDEAKKNSLAKTQLYHDKSDSLFNVLVPEQRHAHDRILNAIPAEGVNFFDLQNEEQLLFGIKVLAMERDIFFAEQDLIYFDADRHAGNYLLNPNPKQGRYEISPIDFGQLSSITKQQRTDVISLFALSQILRLRGHSDDLTSRISLLFDLSSKEKRRLGSYLKANFSIHGGLERLKEEPMLSYSELISIINQSIIPRETKVDRKNIEEARVQNYFSEFVRAISHFSQYEDQLDKAAPGFDEIIPVFSPIKELKLRVAKEMSEISSNVSFSWRQKLVNFSLNTYLYAKSVYEKKEFRKLGLGLKQEDILGFSSAKNNAGEPGGESSRLSREEILKVSSALSSFQLLSKKREQSTTGRSGSCKGVFK